MPFEFGIISACAERTPAAPSSPKDQWDHLRVCGADPSSLVCMEKFTGSSPRVRSGLGRVGDAAVGRRIISACAERTIA